MVEEVLKSAFYSGESAQSKCPIVRFGLINSLFVLIFIAIMTLVGRSIYKEEQDFYVTGFVLLFVALPVAPIIYMIRLCFKEFGGI